MPAGGLRSLAAIMLAARVHVVIQAGSLVDPEGLHSRPANSLAICGKPMASTESARG